MEPAQVVDLQPGEEKLEKLLLFETRREVLHLGVVHVQLLEKYKSCLKFEISLPVSNHQNCNEVFKMFMLCSPFPDGQCSKSIL